MLEITVHYGACNEGWAESFKTIDKALAFAKEVAPESDWCGIDVRGGFDGFIRLPEYTICRATKTGGKWYIGKKEVDLNEATKFIEDYNIVGKVREKKVHEALKEAKKDLPKTGDPLYDAFFNLPEIDIPLTEEEARMQEKIRALCKELEANK